MQEFANHCTIANAHLTRVCVCKYTFLLIYDWLLRLMISFLLATLNTQQMFVYLFIYWGEWIIEEEYLIFLIMYYNISILNIAL